MAWSIRNLVVQYSNAIIDGDLLWKIVIVHYGIFIPLVFLWLVYLLIQYGNRRAYDCDWVDWDVQYVLCIITCSIVTYGDISGMIYGELCLYSTYYLVLRVMRECHDYICWYTRDTKVIHNL